jgi:hypothetical protein
MSRLLGCFADDFMSAWVSLHPQTLHSQATAAPGAVGAELVFHFFDISLSHWGQIMNALPGGMCTKRVELQIG